MCGTQTFDNLLLSLLQDISDSGQDNGKKEATQKTTSVSISGGVPECGSVFFDLQPVTVSHEQAKVILTGKVEVYRVVLSRRIKCGLRVEYKPCGEMQRVVFLEHMLVWLADVVTSGRSSHIVEAQRCDTSMLKAALAALATRDPIEVLLKFKEYIFDSSKRSKDTLTWYAADGKVRDNRLLKEILHEVSQCDRLQELYASDLLKHIGDFDGMTWMEAWMYSGGGALAGHHLEDGFLHFVHVCLKIIVDRSSADSADTDFALSCSVIDATQRLAAKSWLLCRDVKTAEGTMRLVKLLADEGCKHYGTRDSSCSAYWESSLMKREWVLDPAYFCSKYPDVFYEAYVLPGEGLISNESHSVIGFSSFCMAWNVCVEDHLLHYMSQERDMARLARTSVISEAIFGVDSEEPRLHQLRGSYLKFCLTTEAAQMADAVVGLSDNGRRSISGMGPGPFEQHIRRMAPAVNSILQFCWQNYSVQLHYVHLSSSKRRITDVCRTDVLDSGVLIELLPNHSRHVCCVCGEPLIFRAFLAAWIRGGVAQSTDHGQPKKTKKSTV
jgi:hypothetical protein